jgi:hemolysin III
VTHHPGPPSAGRLIGGAERRADAVVHAVGLSAGAVGAILLLAMAVDGRPLQTLSAIVYAVGLVAMLGCSAAYNMARPSRTKWWLRRLDHAAIFLMIAATYTPFLARLQDATAATWLAGVVWTGALAGMVLKIGWPGRFDRLSVALYLALGWAIVLAFGPLVQSVPMLTLALLIAGGALYSVGVIFHLWDSLRFGTAIWHGFVVAAAGCHYMAVYVLMVLSPA